MKRIVLDASAVMAFFENRSGADKVEELITLAVEGKRELFMSVINWGEMYYSVWRAHGQQTARQVTAEVAQLPIEIMDADFELTKLAASFRAAHKLPYADCFAAALAKLNKAAVVTSDRDFSLIQQQVDIVFV
jgi:PIN domain nuclease of toxin-antitoxin system